MADGGFHIQHPTFRPPKGKRGQSPTNLRSVPAGTARRVLRTNGDCPLFPSRRGISLMEVLISVFILSIGLLGVAAMIPLGALSLRDTAKSDYTGACGRAGIHELEWRECLTTAIGLRRQHRPRGGRPSRAPVTLRPRRFNRLPSIPWAS